ncbi:MAG: LPS translocon maturation chaperone LptM [Luteimonas sp.]
MNTRLILLSVTAALALSACGNKGPLVLPDKPVEITPGAVPSATPAPATAPVTPLPSPSPDVMPSPLPPSSPPATTDPVLEGTGDDNGG